MTNRDTVLIQRMIKHIKEAMSTVHGIEYDFFCNSYMHRNSVSYNLSQLGEAASKLSNEYPSIREKNQDIPWKSIIGMRTKVVHEYDNLDYSVIWNVVCNDLPDLIDKLEKINLS
jgi:uncharacterized protein with HEPN domain